MCVEEMLTLKEAAEIFPKPPCTQTLIRRIKVGSRGVRLRAEFDGYRYYTTEQWVNEYLVAVGEARQVWIDHLKAPVMSIQEEADLAYEAILNL